jgi:D-aminoacyl-tRNA deacylase
VHTTGNYGSADLGGAAQTLSKTNPGMMHAILKELAAHVPQRYTVSYEVTHHGPTSLCIPSFFVEIGSTETEWHDKKAAHVVAQAVIEIGKREHHKYSDDNWPVIPLIGFGGNHYAARQTDLALSSRGAFGHIMPTHQVVFLTKEILEQMVKKSKAQGVYIDKKSLKTSDVTTITSFASELNVPVLTHAELMELQDASFSVYRDALTLIPKLFPNKTVTPHLHKIRAITHPAPLTIQHDLILEAQKCDQNGFLHAISELACIHFSGNGIAVLDTFLVDQACISQKRDELIQACLKTICSVRACTYIDNILTIQKKRFSPEKAKKLGISPGPAYGKLIAGQTIVQKGHEITPDMVMDIEENVITVLPF